MMLPGDIRLAEELQEIFDTAMTPYHTALYQCGLRYRSMLVNRDSSSYQALWNFVHEFIEGCRSEMPLPKLCRGLGYIQGVLIERGLTTVEAERDWTRPLFRPLDFPESQHELGRP